MSPFQELSTRNIVLVIAAQPFGIAYSVTVESLVHEINLNAFSILIFKHGIQINQGPVVQKLISSNPGLNCNPPFFISLFKSLLGKIFTILLRTSNNQIASKKIWTEFLLKFSDLKSNFTLTLGYLNPALNNRGQVFKWRIAVS